MTIHQDTWLVVCRLFFNNTLGFGPRGGQIVKNTLEKTPVVGLGGVRKSGSTKLEVFLTCAKGGRVYSANAAWSRRERTWDK